MVGLLTRGPVVAILVSAALPIFWWQRIRHSIRTSLIGFVRRVLDIGDHEQILRLILQENERLQCEKNYAEQVRHRVELQLRLSQRKRQLLKDSVKAIKNELRHEKDGRCVVEHMLNEKIRKLELELELMEEELEKYRRKDVLKTTDSDEEAQEGPVQFLREKEEREDESEEDLSQLNLAFTSELEKIVSQLLVSRAHAVTITGEVDDLLQKHGHLFLPVMFIFLQVLNHAEKCRILHNTPALEKLWTSYSSAVLHYVESENDQMNLLIALQDWALKDPTRTDLFLPILVTICKSGVIELDTVELWYHGEEERPEYLELKMASKPLVDWIQKQEEDDTDSYIESESASSPCSSQPESPRQSHSKTVTFQEDL